MSREKNGSIKRPRSFRNFKATPQEAKVKSTDKQGQHARKQRSRQECNAVAKMSSVVVGGANRTRCRRTELLTTLVGLRACQNKTLQDSRREARGSMRSSGSRSRAPRSRSRASRSRSRAPRSKRQSESQVSARRSCFPCSLQWRLCPVSGTKIIG